MSVRELEALQALATSGRYDEASAGLLALRARDPSQVEAPATLAWIAQQRGDDDACARWLEEVFELDPEHRLALTISVALASKRGDWNAALAGARRFATLEPDAAHAHYNLGITLHRAGDREGAAAAISRALEIDPDMIDAWLAQGWLALERGDYAFAVREFRRVLARAPTSATAWLNLGIAELRLFRGEAARMALERATTFAPQSAAAWRGYAQACELAGDRVAAVAASTRALELAPESAQEALDHALCLARDGRTEAALEAASRAAELSPALLLPAWLPFQLMPYVPRVTEDLWTWRQRWREGLARIEAMPLESVGLAPQLADALTAATNFHRHYLGDDATADQARYGALVTRMARIAFPLPAPVRGSRRGRLRVGFASAHVRRHTISKLFHGWLAHLDRREFEVIAINLGPTVDDKLRELAATVDQMIGPLHTNAAWVEALRSAELDALVYLDVGMDGLTQLLAPLEFAPVQCAAWGHPVTTGLPAIGHFLSGAAMEPENGQAHYTEKLVRLPGLGISYSMPASPRVAARDAAGGPRFLCAQSVYKLLPEQDEVFAQIAARLPAAHFEFVPHPITEVRGRLAARMRPVFAGHGVDFDARVTLHPYLPEARFLERVQAADAMLDTMHWSGGNTTLEGLAFDVPVVTLPGPFMRGRHSHAMLDIMGLAGELSARDPGHYVEIAARLGQDPGFRSGMSVAIRERKHLLFDDAAPIRALEEFLLEACGTA